MRMSDWSSYVCSSDLGGWQLDGTWQHTEDRSEVRATRGKQLPGRFETQLNARVEHSWRGLVFHYAYRYEAGAYSDSPNLLRTQETQRYDLGVSGAVGRLGRSLPALNHGDSHLEPRLTELTCPHSRSFVDSRSVPTFSSAQLVALGHVVLKNSK